MAVATREVGDIEVATGVLPIRVRHPMQLAQRALTVSLISGGRLVLGLRLSHEVGGSRGIERAVLRTGVSVRAGSVP